MTHQAGPDALGMPVDRVPPDAVGAGVAQHDPEPLDAAWPTPWPPSRWDRLPFPGKFALVAVPLAMVGGITWAAGGLRPDTRRQVVPAGTVVEVGPLEVSVDRARALRQSDGTWRITLEGSCRNTTDGPIESISSLVGSAVVVGDATGGFVNPHALSPMFGSHGASTAYRTDLVPSPAASACAFAGQMGDGFQPQDMVRVGIFDADRKDISVLQTGEQSWVAKGAVTVVPVPLVVEPE